MSITYQEVLEKQLKVMDASAISLCMDNNLPISRFQHAQAGQHHASSSRVKLESARESGSEDRIARL